MANQHDTSAPRGSVGKVDTYYATPDRESGATLRQQAGFFASERIMREVIDALPDPVVILNTQRQVVCANRPALQLSGCSELHEVLGMRPGEMLGCKHAELMRGGCGTSEFCITCGAVQVILSGLRGKEEVQECRISGGERGAYDLLVHSRPLQTAGEQFTVFSLRDISHEKRRRLLERLFFHDVLNTAGGLRGMSELLGIIKDEEEFDRTKELIHGLAGELIEEIEAQRDLAAAENSELELSPRSVESAELLGRVANAYRSYGSARQRSIRIDLPHQLPVMQSDERLLRRILGNMVKNGLEATSTGGSVTLGAREAYESGEAGIEFFVHNDRFMPRHVQLQVFQRSFSTKGDDRGLGTYSMRLLGEQYLGGRLRFHSTEDAGTTFYAWIPLVLEEQSSQRDSEE
jgi:signal transduction histidine kinase